MNSSGRRKAPATCALKQQYGRDYCLIRCPATGETGVFKYVRVEEPEDLPPFDERAIDIAVLDMNFGWPNLGHDSIVRAVRDTACDLLPSLGGTGLYLRVISFEVRRKAMIPEVPDGRFLIYLGTGGPGHIDPHRNDGRSEGTQGVKEDPAWEPPLFALFDAIRSEPDAALLAVCHSFGLICKWSGAASPVLRGGEKGGKLSGLVENVLTDQALDHPWFSRLAANLPDGRRLRIVDNRLFDLIPVPGGVPKWITPIGNETTKVGGPRGEALTMIELSRDRGGVMPRMFAVNHHPEVVDRSLIMTLLNEKLASGEVTNEWYRERVAIYREPVPGEDTDRLLHLTADFTFISPLRFQIYRQVRSRAEALGLNVSLHEDRIIEARG